MEGKVRRAVGLCQRRPRVPVMRLGAATTAEIAEGGAHTTTVMVPVMRLGAATTAEIAEGGARTATVAVRLNVCLDKCPSLTSHAAGLTTR